MIAIIDSGIGNVRSVFNALKVIGHNAVITKNPQDLEKADKIIFPGVGAFADGMRALTESELIEPLRETVLRKKKPYLGICLGMQLLAEKGFENGTHLGLGWMAGKVEKLNIAVSDLKLPHIGWNTVQQKDDISLFKDIPQDSAFYFVHSYHFVPQNESKITATCIYGQKFAASIQCNNIFGTQFHPEKSQKNGLQFLRNFVSI